MFSWWLADRVESVLTTNQELANKLTETFIAESIHWSTIGADLIHPRLELSDFACATKFLSPTWILALQCQLHGRVGAIADQKLLSLLQCALEKMIKALGTTDEKAPSDPIGLGLARSNLTMFPASAKSPDHCVYGFDAGVGEVVDAWTKITQDESTKKLLEFSKQARDVNTQPNSLIDALRQLSDRNESDQVFVSGVLRSQVIQGLAPRDEVWNLLVQQEWREKTFNGLVQHALELFLESLAELQAQADDRWRVNLPHILAAACESAKDTTRQRLLFAQTVITSAATNTDSAIRRLLTGPQRHQLISEREFWRDQLRGAIPNVLPWVVGRIRSILPALDSL